MLLPLAERMTQKYVDSNKIDAEAGMTNCVSWDGVSVYEIIMFVSDSESQ